jgi:hypothetical protein
MAAIIEADVGAASARREWLEDGMQEAFQRLSENHLLLLQHFPLDPEREELYGRMAINESQASGSTLSAPFQDVATATVTANKAGLTTDDFAKIVDKLAEFAKVISTMPAPPEPSKPSTNQPTNSQLPDFPIVDPQDRLTQANAPVTARKRALLSGFGFFERAYNLAGSTATLASTEEGKALITALHRSLEALSKLIGW